MLFYVPCRQTLRYRIIPDLFAELKAKLENVIDKNNYFSMTMDGSTSLANESKIDINIFYINSDFELKNHLICFKNYFTKR
jgi:hypothetical protein